MLKTVQFEEKQVTPSKVVCVGRNYVDHINELNNERPEEPVVFLKPNSAISEDLFVHSTDEIHYEGEIVFIVFQGRLTGVGFGLDLTKRQVQNKLKEKGLPWERAKAFDKSAVFSGFVGLETDFTNIRLELYINGELKQSSGCEHMLYKPESLLNEISDFMTFEDFDVIMTGTPSGVGQVKEGDQFTGKIFDGDKLLVEKIWQAQIA